MLFAIHCHAVTAEAAADNNDDDEMMMLMIVGFWIALDVNVNTDEEREFALSFNNL